MITKVLVLGGGGMLGADLTELLRETGMFDVSAFGSQELDITRQEAMEEAFMALRPDIVINCAAYTDVDGAETETEKAMQINGHALEHVSRSCNGAGARLVHISTDYVFDGTREEGYREHDPPAPINAYGRSKLLGEEMIRQHCKQYSIIRTSWLFGRHGKNFVDTIRHLLSTRETIKVVNDQTGSPTWTRDLASGIMKHIQQANPASDIYHLTNSGSCTWYEFACEIQKQAGTTCDILPCTTADFPRPARRPAYSILINTKLPALAPWQDALKKYVS